MAKVYEPRRDAQGDLLVVVKDLGIEAGPLRFRASTVPAAKAAIQSYAGTPRLAVAELVCAADAAFPHVRSGRWTGWGGETARLLSTRYKAPGENRGGRPRRDAAAPSSSKLTVNLTALERLQLTAYALERGITESDVARAALQALGALPAERTHP